MKFAQAYYSPSQIKSGVRCPYSWAATRTRLPSIEMDRTYADAGIATHEAIAEYYQVISPKPHSGLIEGTFTGIIDKHWKAMGLDKIKKIKSRRDKCTQNFIDFEKKRLTTWQQYKPTMIERRIQATVHNIVFRTIPDVYWRTDATIVDWKSGAMNTLSEMEFIQGHVEKMVYRALNYPVKRVIFVCLLAGLELELPNLSDDYVVSRVKELEKYRRTGEFPKRKGDHCRWCSHSLRCELESRGWHLWV